MRKNSKLKCKAKRVQFILSTTERDNVLDRPSSADTAQVPPTEWGSRQAAQPGHSIQVDMVGGCTGVGFHTVKGDLRIRPVWEAKSMLYALVCLHWLDWVLTPAHNLSLPKHKLLSFLLAKNKSYE